MHKSDKVQRVDYMASFWLTFGLLTIIGVGIGLILTIPTTFTNRLIGNSPGVVALPFYFLTVSVLVVMFLGLIMKYIFQRTGQNKLFKTLIIYLLLLIPAIMATTFYSLIGFPAIIL